MYGGDSSIKLENILECLDHVSLESNIFQLKIDFCDGSEYIFEKFHLPVIHQENRINSPFIIP